MNTLPVKKKCGRKSGCNIEEVNLRSGGQGGRALNNNSPWKIDLRDSVNLDDSDGSYSQSESSEEDEEDIFEDEINCVSDLEGNRLLPIGKVLNAMSNNMCCAKCATANHKTLMEEFIDFCSAYEDKIAEEENDRLFFSKLERLEWRSNQSKTVKEMYAMYNGGRTCPSKESIVTRFIVSEETMGCATSLYGFCGRKRRPHKFRIEPDTIQPKISSSFHHHARGKLFTLNYQLAAVIQQMGCGPADLLYLCGYLSLPGASIQYHIRRAEEVMGPLQIEQREASERDAVLMEIEAAKSKEGDELQYHECNIEGHQHASLPKIKGSYGEK